MADVNINFNIKTQYALGGLANLKTYIDYIKNLKPLLDRIKNDIYISNKSVFEHYGTKSDGEGISWPFNGRYWSSFKVKYQGETVHNPFSGGKDTNDFFDTITVESTEVCVLTGRLKRALTEGGDGMEDHSDDHSIKIKCTVPYLDKLQKGYTFARPKTNKKTGEITYHTGQVPSRNIFWLSAVQKEKYRQWALEYLEAKSLRSK